MTAPLHLDAAVSSLDAIPEQYRPDAPIEQRDYLVDGQLRHWDARWRRYAARYSSPRPTASAR